MSKKTQILCILTTMIFGVAMFIATSYKTSYADEVEGVYQVYLNGEKIGMIDSQDELYALINEEQSSIKDEYNVDQVYPPKGFSITKLNTYNSSVSSVTDIYDKIKLLYSNAKKVCHEKNSFKEERIQIQKYIFKENELLTDFFKLSQTDYTEDLSYWLILTLSNQKKYNKVDFDKIKIVLKILKIHMNEWELLLLQSSMHFYKII